MRSFVTVRRQTAFRAPVLVFSEQVSREGSSLAKPIGSIRMQYNRRASNRSTARSCLSAFFLKSTAIVSAPAALASSSRDRCWFQSCNLVWWSMRVRSATQELRCGCSRAATTSDLIPANFGMRLVRVCSIRGTHVMRLLACATIFGLSPFETQPPFNAISPCKVQNRWCHCTPSGRCEWTRSSRFTRPSESNRQGARGLVGGVWRNGPTL